MTLKANLIAEAYKSIGIDALNVGELDLALGVNYLLGREKSLRLPLISSNIVYRDGGKNVFQPFVIRRVNGINVAVFGLLPVFSTESIGGDKDIRILPPFEIAAMMVERLRKKADIVILLSNLGQPEDEKLAGKITDIDIIIGGRNRVLLKTPLRIGETLILQALAQGKQIGRLDFNPKDRTFINSITPMDDKMLKNEEIEDMVKRYKNAVVSLNSDKSKPASLKVPEETYTGKDACARCHSKQAASWKLTKHAGAYETLIERNNHLDLECVRCHVTGYGTIGGFRLGIENPDLKGVQCEVCHGPGGKHRGKGDIRREIDAATCMGCHNAEKDPDFNIASYVNKIRCPK